MVLFPTSFAPRGTSQGSKDLVAPLATVAAVGVGVGVGEGDSLKTCGRIENSGDNNLEEPAHKPQKALQTWKAWEVAIVIGGSKSIILNSAIHSLMHSLRKVLGLTEEMGGVGEQEGWKCIMEKP
jgi:hypothetical protein